MCDHVIVIRKLPQKSVGKQAGKLASCAVCWKESLSSLGAGWESFLPRKVELHQGAETEPRSWRSQLRSCRLPEQFPSVYGGEESSSFCGMEKWSSDPEDLTSVPSIRWSTHLLHMKVSWTWQSVLSLQLLNDSGDHLTAATGSARTAVVEQTSHVGVSFNECFSQWSWIQSQPLLLSASISRHLQTVKIQRQ